MEIEIHSAKNLEISCHNEGEGDLLPEGTIVNVKYEGRLEGNGHTFDENFTKEGLGYELDLTAGNKMAIDGWYLALRQMRLN
jgi:FKBP-type peptidyl-prolyl cis-trans isomerase